MLQVINPIQLEGSISISKAGLETSRNMKFGEVLAFLLFGFQIMRTTILKRDGEKVPDASEKFDAEDLLYDLLINLKRFEEQTKQIILEKAGEIDDARIAGPNFFPPF